MITLVIGGARSGKSAVAERLVTELAEEVEVTYLATGLVDDSDLDFAARVAAHRRRRPKSWVTLECGAELASSLSATSGPAIVDSLGTWVGARWFDHQAGATGSSGRWDDGPGADVDRAVEELALALRARSDAGLPTVLVTEEVGLGVHPESEVGRTFRDLLGRVNVEVAALADDVLLVVAGLTFRPADR